jgi:predicted AlkP superfamily phosphohydrolase/phosphomutase
LGEKVFVLGLDGMTFNLLEPLITEEKLPNFKKVMNGGVSCNLISTIPPITPAAWTSFMTGKNPEKHGIFGFLDNRTDHTHNSIVDSTSIKSLKLWNILNNHQKKTGLINIPLTHPAESVYGFMVPGFPCPDENISNFTYPVELYEELLDAIGEYVVDIKAGQVPTSTNSQILSYINGIKHMIQKRRDTLFYLLKKYPVDFLMVVFAGPDRIQHCFWKWLDKSDPLSNSELAKRYRDLLIDCYIQLDIILGEILVELDENCTLIIMSDHGFGPINFYVHLNEFFSKNNLLSFNKALFAANRITARLPLKYCNLVKFNKYINWDRTKAYSGNIFEQGVYINLKGRQKCGVVNSGKEYNDIIDLIKKLLYDLKNPKSGDKIVQNIFTKEEIYTGKNLDNSPDLLIQMKDPGYLITDGVFLKSLFNSQLITSVDLPWGYHRREGIFIAYGKHIVENNILKSASICDVMPTILYLMDIPIPSDLDGSVIKKIFNKNFVDSRTTKYADPIMSKNIYTFDKIYTPDEKADISQRLEDLGYL